jgi:hypothetical protein
VISWHRPSIRQCSSLLLHLESACVRCSRSDKRESKNANQGETYSRKPSPFGCGTVYENSFGDLDRAQSEPPPLSLFSIFHIISISFLVLAFRDLSSLRAHFRPFTKVVRKIPPEVTRKVKKTCDGGRGCRRSVSADLNETRIAPQWLQKSCSSICSCFGHQRLPIISRIQPWGSPSLRQ